MRHAPKWRSFIPTAREIRFGVQRGLEQYAPQVLRLANLYMTQGDWSELAAETPHIITLKSDIEIDETEAKLYEFDFRLDVAHCGGVFHRNSQWNIEIGKFTDALIFGHSGQAVDTRSNCSITDVSRNTARPYLGGHCRRIDTPCVNFLNFRLGEQNYYHFMVETTVLMRHVIAHALSSENRIKVLVHPETRENEKVLKTHLLRECPGLSFETVNENERIYAKTLLQHRLHTNCSFRSPSRSSDLKQISDIYRQAYNAPQQEHIYKIYISRKDARVRKISNEHLLVEKLRDLHFKIVAPGQLSLRDQVCLFSQARCIVGTHGAGLANLIFMKPGGRVVEIFGNDYVQGAYMWLSRLSGHEYDYVIGQPAGRHQNLRLGDADIQKTIDCVEQEDHLLPA